MALGVVIAVIETLVPGAFFLWLGIAAIATGFVKLIVPGMGWEGQLIVFAIFVVYALYVSFIMSFHDWDLIGTPTYVGLENYREGYEKHSSQRVVLDLSFGEQVDRWSIITKLFVILFFALVAAMCALLVSNRFDLPFLIIGILSGTLAILTSWRALRSLVRPSSGKLHRRY